MRQAKLRSKVTSEVFLSRKSISHTVAEHPYKQSTYYSCSLCRQTSFHQNSGASAEAREAQVLWSASHRIHSHRIRSNNCTAEPQSGKLLLHWKYCKLKSNERIICTTHLDSSLSPQAPRFPHVNERIS